MSTTLQNLLESQRKFDEAHAAGIPFFVKIGKENIEELEHLLVCILGELGEFSNLVKKVRRGDVEFDDVKPALDEEIVDVFIYLLKIANQFDVDLESGYKTKMQKNVRRFSKFER
ncbi:nucleotide pyrophosphohydrolase [Herbaspirillum sp. C7C2]|uniref:MazG nucleotide pyrophosphohydrolase domain-containing protein n=1 Tax=Herbaspirillum sp. C7C2 TaxID=2736666 RepID=UPI001F520745|nr:MazG nucleotide pyrophosphohydrolase domain-containing protein [Herbaspirillum sp. C7C2]MCI1012636.1 nucleotide pyrophosphohydrolase [Herbaspirillum sp. C7C2]